MAQNLPFVSVIVPTHGRVRHLVACLQSLAAQDYPRDRFEVIVAVDGDGDPPESLIAPLRDSLDLRIHTQTQAGPAAARNAGAEGAKGEFLAFTDDDCEPAPDWLPKLIARFAATPDCAIGGRTINVLADRYAAATQLLIDYLYSHYNADPKHARLLASNNLALPAGRFRAIGGFDVEYTRAGGEDRDFCHRWLHKGYRLIYAPEAVVYHSHPMTFRLYCQQHFNYGRGSFLYHRERPWRGDTTPGSSRLSFHAKLLLYPLSRAQGGQKLSVTALFLLSQASTAAGFVYEALTGN